jgi:hypothetical protein
LTPSSTVPSTRLVIIWLKRCLARSLTDPALEFEPVGVGVGLGDALGVGVGVGEGEYVGVGEGEYVGDGLCAEAGTVSAGISSREIAAASAVDRVKLRVNFAIVSARTACRWDRCRRRQAA